MLSINKIRKAKTLCNIFHLGCSFDDREKLTNRMFNASILIEIPLNPLGLRGYCFTVFRGMGISGNWYMFVLYRDIPLFHPPLHRVMWNMVNLRQIRIDWQIVSLACVVLSVMTCQRKTSYSSPWRLITMSVVPSIFTSSHLEYRLCLRTGYLWLDYSI